MTVAHEAFASIVKRFISRAGLDQQEIAEKIGRSPAYVSRLVRGVGIAQRTVGKLLALCAILGLSEVERDGLIRAVFGTAIEEEVEAYNRLFASTAYLENTRRYRREKEAVARQVVTDPTLLGRARLQNLLRRIKECNTKTTISSLAYSLLQNLLRRIKECNVTGFILS